MAVGHSMGYRCLSLFRGIDYKFLLVMVRKKAKQNRFKDLFLKEKGEI